MSVTIERHDLSRASVRRFRPRLGRAHVFSVPSTMASAELTRLVEQIKRRVVLHGDCWDVATVVTRAGGLRVIVVDPDAALDHTVPAEALQ